MPRKRWSVLAAAIVAVILIGTAVYVLTRPQLTDEQKIIRLVAQGQEAVEKNNSTGLTRLISRDYMDKSGATRQQLVGYIVQWMHGSGELRVSPEITRLKINGDFADVDLKVRAWMGREISGPGLEYALAVRLRREGRDWKVISAEGYAEAQSDLMSGE